MAKQDALSILTYSNLFPNTQQPTHGIFVARRLDRLVATGKIQATVMAPVPWFPLKVGAFGRYASFARVSNIEEHNGLQVVHPRFMALPLLGAYLNPIAMAAASIRLVRAIDRVSRIDLIDAHYVYPDGVAATIIAKVLRKPLVITARGSDVNLLPHYRVPRMWIVWSLKVADRLIGVSEALSQKLVELGAPRSRVVTLRNGVDSMEFRPLDYAESRKALGLSGRILLSVGNLVESKGHHLVIEALSKIQDTELVIVGDGPYRNRLIEAAQRHRVEARVRFTGMLAREELIRYYSAADALVLASSMEGMPNVVLEALSCGLPVVASDCGGVREVVIRPELGTLIRPGDSNAVVRGIADVFDHYPDRATVRRYAEGLGWEDTIRRQLAVYQDAVNDAKRQSR